MAQDRTSPPSHGTKARPLRSAPTAVFHEYKEPSQPNRLFEGTPCFSCGPLELQAEKGKKSKKKKRIRFSEELLGKTKLVFFQRQVLGGVCWVSILPYLLKESELFPKYIIILTGQMEVSGYKAKILHFSKSRHFSYQRLTKLC